MRTMILIVIILLSALLIVQAVQAESGTAHDQTLYTAESLRTLVGSRDHFTGDVTGRWLFPTNKTTHYASA